MSEFDPDTFTRRRTDRHRRVKEPPLYHVILLNDHYTTMDFVVYVLMRIFHHSQDRARELMWQVHTEGRALAGTYSLDIARTKQRRVHDEAKKREFPFRAILRRA